MICLVRRMLALLAVISIGVVMAGGSASAQVATLNVSVTSVAAGSRVTVTGTCDPNSSGYVLSGAFLGLGEFAGVSAVAFTTDGAGRFSFTVRINPAVVPATYSVGARCGGGNLGISRSLRVVQAQLAATGIDSDRGVPVAMGLTGLGLVLLLVARRRPVAV